MPRGLPRGPRSVENLSRLGCEALEQVGKQRRLPQAGGVTQVALERGADDVVEPASAGGVTSAERDREASGGDAVDVLVAGRDRGDRGRDERRGIGKKRLGEVLLDTGDLALGNGVDAHRVVAARERIGKLWHRVVSCGAREEEAAGAELAVELGLDRGQDPGCLPVLVEAHRRNS